AADRRRGRRRQPPHQTGEDRGESCPGRRPAPQGDRGRSEVRMVFLGFCSRCSRSVPGFVPGSSGTKRSRISRRKMVISYILFPVFPVFVRGIYARAHTHFFPKKCARALYASTPYLKAGNTGNKIPRNPIFFEKNHQNPVPGRREQTALHR